MSSNKLSRITRKATMLQHLMHSHHADFHIVCWSRIWHKITAMAKNHNIFPEIMIFTIHGDCDTHFLAALWINNVVWERHTRTLVKRCSSSGRSGIGWRRTTVPRPSAFATMSLISTPSTLSTTWNMSPSRHALLQYTTFRYDIIWYIGLMCIVHSKADRKST